MEPHAHTLYVILQGEFAVYRERKPTSDDVLHILAPDLPPKNPHVYKAGPWHSKWQHMPELPPNARLYLRHAIGDRKQGAKPERMSHHPRSIPEKNTDLLLSCGPEHPNPAGARVHITAPIPIAILSGVAETTSGAMSTYIPDNGKPVNVPVPPQAAVILILLFKWHGKRPCLSDHEHDHEGQRVWKTGGPKEYQSIHVYASSRTDENDPGHAQQAFAAAAQLLGQNACIKWPEGAKFRRFAAIPPAGLTWAQVNFFLSEVIACQNCQDCKDCPGILDSDFVDLQTTHLPFKWEPLAYGSFTNCGAIRGDDDGRD
jgi:hypothetical protein